MRTPVDNPFAAVNQAFFVQPYKYFAHGFGTPFIQRKTFPIPIAGGTQLLQLPDNTAAVLFFPFPGALQKSVTADLLFREALFAHLLHNFRFRCNGGVIGARQPQRAVALHPPPADQNILEGFVQRMAHVKLAGNIRRRDNNRIWLFRRFPLGMKVFSVEPELIYPVFHFLWIVGFGKLPVHVFCFLL